MYKTIKHLIKNGLLVFVSLTLITSCTGQKRLSILLADGKILAFGDSLTFGTGSDEGHSYPDKLAELTKLEVVNAGVPGELSSQGLVRLPKLLTLHQPNLLILCHGGNDLLRKQSTQALKQNLIAMINLSREHNIEVVMVGVPEVHIFGSVHPVYEQVAEQLNVPIESTALNSLLKDTQYKSDYVHLNNAGYQKLANYLFELLKQEGAI